MKPVVRSVAAGANSVVSMAPGRRPSDPPEATRSRQTKQSTRAGVLAYLDPSPLTRECVSRWLTNNLREMRVRAIADPGALEELARADSDVRLLVINIDAVRPGQALLEAALADARRHWPEIVGIVLSPLAEPAEVERVFRVGVRGYITVETPEVVLEAIRLVLVGGAYQPVVMRQAPHDGSRWPQPAIAAFTRREAEILGGIRLGEPNKRIAAVLNMSESTVKVHVHNIMKKLGAKNRTQVANLTRDLPPPEAV